MKRLREERVQLGVAAAANDDVYGGADRSAFATELDVGGAEDDDMDDGLPAAGGEVAARMASYTAPKALLAEVPRGEVEDVEQARALAARVSACRFLGLATGARL